ncbi:MAG: hypothetical protein QNJ70_18205 [Xenococcaceae cyanobacterium MO_207.B15]|nr:hypothetical protein [Xenococcaceae cyanobacterium MO_207.B15]
MGNQWWEIHHRLYQQILDKWRGAGIPYRELGKPLWVYPTGVFTQSLGWLRKPSKYLKINKT